MNKMKVYEYAKCSTCRKALKFLDQNKVEYEKKPIVETPPSKSELRKMLGFLNGDLKKVFNTSGTLYREMGMSERLKSISIEDAIQLLAENGKLIKRPFAITSENGVVGFDESSWKKFLNG